MGRDTKTSLSGGSGERTTRWGPEDLRVGGRAEPRTNSEPGICRSGLELSAGRRPAANIAVKQIPRAVSLPPPSLQNERPGAIALPASRLYC